MLQHMEVLVDHIGDLRGQILQRRRAAMISPWFTAHLMRHERGFNAAKVNKERVVCIGKITKYLTMDEQKWGVDVDTLYAPMIWGSCHWVGLCISLESWSVMVMDPNPRLKTMAEVREIMEPIAAMLPYLVKNVCPSDTMGEHELVPFHVERLEGVYENIRSGDCGPVSAKFMEMHATGDEHPTMAGLTDELVDIIRKDYAINIYRKWVVPLYVG